jgi:hypothetical protein
MYNPSPILPLNDVDPHKNVDGMEIVHATDASTAGNPGGDAMNFAPDALDPEVSFGNVTHIAPSFKTALSMR